MTAAERPKYFLRREITSEYSGIVVKTKTVSGQTYRIG